MSRGIQHVLQDLSRIYDYLQVSGGATLPELSARLGIPRTTLYRHLDYLRGLYGADCLEREGEYIQLAEDAPVVLTVSAQEHQALALGARLLERIGMPLAGAHERLHLRLAGGDRRRSSLARIRAREQVDRVLAFCEPHLCRVPADRELAARLFGLCAAEPLRPVRFTYRSRRATEATDRRVLPLGLVFANAWYLLGQGDGDPPVKMYALDRMERLRDEAFGGTVRPDFDIQAYVSRAWRLVTGDGPLVEVLIDMPLDLALEAKHASQMLVEPRGSRALVRFMVVEPLEMMRFVMAHADRVKVEAPVALQEAVRERLRAALSVHP